jgi:hypothetical protein
MAAGFAGKTVRISSYTLDLEASVLTQQLMDCLIASGIKVDNQTASIMPVGTFATGIVVSGSDEIFVDLVTNALAGKAGLTVTSRIDSTGENGPDAIVLVGVKPAPSVEPTQSR